VIVDYADAVAAFFSPRQEGTALPVAVAEGSPARRLRDACEPVAMHAVWSQATNERLAQLGLEFLTSYVGGRGACLGDPAGAVVAAAFAWFEPGLVASLWDAARAAVAPGRLAQARDEATVASLREILAGEDPGEVASLLADAAAAADGAGRPLFSGRRADGRPGDAVHRLWWACGLVREHRGDSHVAAAAAAGLDPVEMNILTELWIGMPLLSYTATRGWAPEVMRDAVARLESRGWVRDGALTGEGLAVRLSIEQHTDAQEQPIVAALGDRLDEVCGRLNHWGQLCIEAGAFPPDILKRAAG
jgi:Helix-turn-helix family